MVRRSIRRLTTSRRRVWSAHGEIQRACVSLLRLGSVGGGSSRWWRQQPPPGWRQQPPPVHIGRRNGLWRGVAAGAAWGNAPPRTHPERLPGLAQVLLW